LSVQDTNKRHLHRIRDAGIPWVRMDVKKPVAECEYLFREAHDLGLDIIAPMTSKRMLKGHGFGTEHYFPGSGLGRKWKNHIEEAVRILHPYVKIWQIDNELNHPLHNPVPSINMQLRVDIVRGGIDVVKNIDSSAKIAVNLFHELRGPLGFPYVRDKAFIRKLLQEIGNSIDILGIDIYRDSWHLGTPAQYPDDLERIHSLWHGDVMIMETGFCTGLFGGSENDQACHVRSVFRRLDNHIRNVPWFSGIMWYEYASRHAKIPCENYFGLHKYNGFDAKPAWTAFVKEVNRYRTTGKILGITYHY
jgi:hypothetical protein